MVDESSNAASGTPTTLGGLGEDKPNLRDTVDEVTGAAEGTTGLGRSARAKVEKVRASAARGLDSAAGAVHASGDRVASAAHRTGDALASGATYLRGNDTGDMVDDFMDLLRDHPGPALVCATALGFLLGRAVYRR